MHQQSVAGAGRCMQAALFLVAGKGEYTLYYRLVIITSLLLLLLIV